MLDSFHVRKLWNGEIPFSKASDSSISEHFMEDKGDGIQRLTDVVSPDITFFPVSGQAPHPAVVVCPGGSYTMLAWNHEGKDICAWLNSIGFSAFLLKYRCPDRRKAACADAVRAMRVIRSNAREYGIDPHKLGILGFSAGGHLAAAVSAPASAEPYSPVDRMDEEPFRPDFTVLVYPAYLADKDLALAPEFSVSKEVPPTFLVQAEDDGVLVENSIAWFISLKRAGVKAELHVFPDGGHGYGILRTGYPIAEWPGLAGNWLRRQAGIK